MKRILAVSAVLITLISFSSCREDYDPHMYYGETMQMAYDTYAGQFDFIWRNINTGYVFWDIDKTPWDEVYDEYMPKFAELDSQVALGKSIPDSVLLKLYKSAMGQMSDHHMRVVIKNLHPCDADAGQISFKPGVIAMEQRPEYIESKASALSHMVEFQRGIVQEFEAAGDIKVIEHNQIKFDLKAEDMSVSGVIYSFNLFQLPDGRLVPYLWQNYATITPVFEFYGQKGPAGQAADILDRFFTCISTTPKEKLAGFILDNRTNSGGYQDDLDYLIGSFINDEVVMFQTRYKEGPGRLEYSAWTDYKQRPFDRYHRDICAEGIPYIILTDLLSISMGEIEPIAARQVLPVAYIVGERSYGATGPLQPDFMDLTYGGSFGEDDLSTGHYVYTSDFETLVGGVTNYEGKGIEPDLEVIRKEHGGSFRAAIDAALEYIAGK